MKIEEIDEDSSSLSSQYQNYQKDQNRNSQPKKDENSRKAFDW